LHKYSGPPKYTFGIADEQNRVGIVTGLAYTEVGGDLLNIEAVSVPGSGKIKSTGKLGDVMQESIQAAYSFVTSRCIDYGFTSRFYKNRDIHLHVPEGATPKEGPSAGIAICTALVSLLTGIPAKASVAMTGEVSLRGMAMQIGGLKEKLLAALRGGIKTVLIPKDNEKDLAEMPMSIKKGLEIIPVRTVDEVLKIALTEELHPLMYDELPNFIDKPLEIRVEN
jgi:ATP-dependent Lon protease